MRQAALNLQRPVSHCNLQEEHGGTAESLGRPSEKSFQGVGSSIVRQHLRAIDLRWSKELQEVSRGTLRSSDSEFPRLYFDDANPSTWNTKSDGCQTKREADRMDRSNAEANSYARVNRVPSDRSPPR